MTKFSRISVNSINVTQWSIQGMHVPLLPACMQSTPSLEFFSFTCLDLIDAKVSMGLNPEFSASAIGTESNASANARMAYCSSPGLCTNINDRAREDGT